MTVLPLISIEQIIGNLLGDGGIAYTHTSVNPFLFFSALAS